MSRFDPRLMAAAKILNELPTGEELAIDRWNRGAPLVEDIDRFVSPEDLRAFAMSLIRRAMPCRRLLRAGRDLPMETDIGSILGQLAAYGPEEQPPNALLERFRTGLRSYPTDKPDLANENRAWIIAYRLFGALDAMPFRRAMAAGEYGPEAAAKAPPAGFGSQFCPIGCGYGSNLHECLCTGTATELSVEISRRRHAARVTRQRGSSQAPNSAPDAANPGQTRSTLAQHTESASAAANPTGDRATETDDTVGAAGEAVIEPYSEPPRDLPPRRRRDPTWRQDLHPAHRRSGRW